MTPAPPQAPGTASAPAPDPAPDPDPAPTSAPSMSRARPERPRRAWLLLLLAPTATVLLRLPFVLTRAGLYGSDAYLHLFIVKKWVAVSAWPATHPGHTSWYLDYEAWPGSHAFAAAAAQLGADPLVFMQWAPLAVVFVLVLAVTLSIARLGGVRAAVAGGVLFGLADHIFFQTQWYTPELLSFPLLGALLLNELSAHRRWLSLLLLTALLVTHHLSFLVGLLLFMLLTPWAPRRWLLACVAYLLAVSMAFWGWLPRWVGSVDDLRAAMGGVSPALFVAAVILGLLGLRWAVEAVSARLSGRASGGPLLGLLPGGSRLAGRPATVIIMIVAAIVVAGALALALGPPVGDGGIGVQPTKLLVLAAGLTFVAWVPAERQALRLASTASVLVLLLLLNPVAFGFARINIRFLEFIYLPGLVLLGMAASPLREGTGRRATAILLAMMMAVPVLLADDVVRYQSDDAQRFVFSETDLDFARQVGEVTEPDAIVVAPFALSAMIWGMTERPAGGWPLQKALDAGGYQAALPDLERAADAGYPIYLVHSSDRVRYIEEAGDRVTDADVARLAASLADLTDSFEPVLELGPATLYRFHASGS